MASSTQGDPPQAAVRIKADKQLALSALNGKLNMPLVKTAREMNQKRGESDPLYQRTRETGSYEESASDTRIYSALHPET